MIMLRPEVLKIYSLIFLTALSDFRFKKQLIFTILKTKEYKITNFIPLVVNCQFSVSELQNDVYNLHTLITIYNVIYTFLRIQ